MEIMTKGDYVTTPDRASNYFAPCLPNASEIAAICGEKFLKVYRTGRLLPSYGTVRPRRRITDSCMEIFDG